MPNEGHIFIPGGGAASPVVYPAAVASGQSPVVAGNDGLEAGPCLVSDDARANQQMRAMYKQSLLEEQLDPVEERLRQWEKSMAAARRQRWAGQERWQGREQEEARLANIRTPEWFMRRLAAVGVKAAANNPELEEWVRAKKDQVDFNQRQYEAKVREAAAAGEECEEPRPASGFEIIGTCGPRLWLNDFSRAGLIGVSAWVIPPHGSRAWELGVYKMETVTSLQYPWGPEFSVMRFNEYNVPVNERFRGWRTALLVLVSRGLVTERQAERAFGAVDDFAGSFYLEQLQQIRSAPAANVLRG